MENCILAIFDEIWPMTLYYSTGSLEIWPMTLYYSTGSLAKFHQKWQGENSPFLLHFLMHIHVLMLCTNFELIPIKIGFFINC